MQLESLRWWQAIFVFLIGLLVTPIGVAALFARDAEGKRTVTIGVGATSMGVFFLLWSTGLLARLSSDHAQIVVAVVGGLFAFSVLWNLRGVLRRPPSLDALEAAITPDIDLPAGLRAPTKTRSAEAEGRLGLVLEGGGAKGAYAFGCIKAFSDAGLRFDAVAGSSVGGLNAALLAAGRLQFGDEYWGSIAHGKVYRLRWRGLALLPVLLLRALLYGASEVTGIKEASPRAVVPRLMFAGLLLVLGTWVVAAIGHVVGWQGAPTFSTGLTYAGLLVLGVVVISIPLLLDSLALSLLMPSPLKRQVESIASGIDPSAIRVYVTLCERVALVDPDHITGIDQTGGTDQPLEELALLPVYTLLNEIDPSERTQAIMASAALPVGIFPPVTVNGRRYTDGGEVDNLPVYPLMSLFPCDTLVVVRLRPHVNPSPVARYAGYMLNWARSDRATRLPHLPRSDALALVSKAYGGDLEKTRTINFPPTLFRYREPVFSPRTIITIAPAQSLGGFLTGTLNFRSKKTREWLEQGYRDAQAAIAEIKASVGDGNALVS